LYVCIKYSDLIFRFLFTVTVDDTAANPEVKVFVKVSNLEFIQNE